MAAQMVLKYTGGASNADPDLSLGGTGSSVSVITSPTLNNLFDNVLPTDTLSGEYIDYRAIDLYNYGANGALHVQFFMADTPNDESLIECGFDSVGTQEIASDTTAPIGITFLPHSYLDKLDLPNLAAGERHRLWIRRTVDQGAENLNDDTGSLHSWFS